MPYNRRAGSSNRNEIVHIVVTGYKKRKAPSKHYVFVIDVTWNNSERFEVYRRYSDFFSFQTTLKALFPSAAGRRDEERIIPQMPKRIFVGRSHVARVAEARLEQINKYCQTLISLEPKVSESAHVVGFFSPRIGDKQLPKLHLHRPASLHPQNVPAGSLFEEYVALAEYVAEDSSQVSFKAGEKVLVMSKDESGWWMCEVKGTVGWAPPSYLKKCSDGNCDEESDEDEDYLGFPESYISRDPTKDKDSDDSGVGDPINEPGRPTPPKKQGFKVLEIDVEEYKAIDSYEAIGPGQIGFELGDVITVLDKMEDGWWFVSNGQDEGWAPCSYLQNVNGEEEEELTTSLDIVRYVTVDSYEAEEDDELSFPKGVIVDVLQKSLDGWWLVKHGEKIALAPATFLKSGIGEQGDQQFPSPTRRASPPPPTFTTTFQQPPRKRSVMYKASLRGKPAGKRQHPETTTTSTAASSVLSSPKAQIKPPVPAERPFSPRRKSNLEGQAAPSSVSPQSSDSEIEGTSPTSPHSLAKGGIMSRIKQFENYSASESSLSSMSTISEEGSITPRPPVAVPRTRTSIPNPASKPKTPPKLRNQDRSHSAEELESEHAPPLLPRFNDSDTTQTSPLSSSPRSIPQINKQLIKDEPNRPPRPRMSEIRRARADKMRSPSPRLGLGAVTEESEDSDTTSVSSRSSVGTHSRVVPVKPKMKKGRSNSSADLMSTGLRPPLPERPRRKSDSGMEEQREAVAMATVPQVSGGEDNPLNQQMADTLIKYILASNDPNLKTALRNIITSDPAVMNVIKE